MARLSKRQNDELRKISITRNYLKFSRASNLIEMGDTKVICTATCDESVPPFLRGTGKGWVTAEYSMLPRSGSTRIRRESSIGRPTGRTQEIQRLIGRCLRAVVDLEGLGERTILIDCDVIQADGGTRTASITGGFVALMDSIRILQEEGLLQAIPLFDTVAAVSVGMVNGSPLLDLDYLEDSSAEVDMNVVMTGAGKLVEVQGTAESTPFSKADMDSMLKLAEKGINKLIALQREVLGDMVI